MSKWTPIRKIASQMWVALAGNAAVGGTIAAGGISDWKVLGYSAASSFLVIFAGYFTKPVA